MRMLLSLPLILSLELVMPEHRALFPLLPAHPFRWKQERERETCLLPCTSSSSRGRLHSNARATRGRAAAVAEQCMAEEDDGEINFCINLFYISLSRSCSCSPFPHRKTGINSHEDGKNASTAAAVAVFRFPVTPGVAAERAPRCDAMPDGVGRR